MDYTHLNIPKHSILGMNYSGMHDSSVAIVAPDGEVVYAASLERISRKKQDGSFPEALLENIPWEQIESIALSNAEHYIIPENQESTIHPVKLDKELPSDRAHFETYYKQILTLKKRVEFFPHHLSHASSAFWGSGYEDAICLVYDGGMRNEHWFGGVYGASLESGIETLDLFSTQLYSNITFIYTAVTALLGFTPLKHEGKITGLAAYGTATEACRALLTDWLHRPHLLHGIFDWEDIYNKPHIVIDYNKLSQIQEEISIFTREELAATVQMLTEEHIIKILENISKQYPHYKNICLSGGLFANVKVNQKVYEFGFNQIFISPSMSDDGTAIGAAWLALEKKKKIQNSKYRSMYLGNSEVSDLDKFLSEIPELKFSKVENPSSYIAKKLSAGQICAIYQGRSEFGPRALGNRSIIAQAIDYDINNGLNTRLSRTEFMPFAPVTRDVDAPLYFQADEGELFACKFMTITTHCTEKAANECPAVVHIDNTARPQIIGYDDNPLMYDILKEYADLTKRYALVNTSFNIHEEPIVDSYEDALRGFFESGLDYLYLDGVVISYKENHEVQSKYLKEKLKRQEKKIKSLTLDLSKQKSSCKSLNKILIQTHADISQLKKENADSLHMNKKITFDYQKVLKKHQKLLHSRSWNLTKPLREVAKLLRKFNKSE